VASAHTVTGLDPFLAGLFRDTGDTVDIGCGVGDYHSSGPQQVSRSSNYVMADVSRFFNGGFSLCLGVYDRPFDPSNPTAGQIAILPSGTDDEYEDPNLAISLAAGQDYYFVVTPNYGHEHSYFYLLLPSGDVYIDPVLSGAWYDPATPGQGFLLDVLSSTNRVFLAWFTYDLQREGLLDTPYLGDAGHRWLTAAGDFHDADAVLDITVSSGGVFDQPLPTAENHTDGSLRLHFFDCQSGEVSYDLGSAGRSGVIPIQRISEAAAQPCKTLMDGAGKPRRLMDD
jgi:hypothetical protein